MVLESDDEECSTQVRLIRRKYEELRNQISDKMGGKKSMIIDACDSDNSVGMEEYVPINVNKKTKVDTSSQKIIIDTHCHLEFIKKRFKRDVSLAECMELDGEHLGDNWKSSRFRLWLQRDPCQ